MKLILGIISIISILFAFIFRKQLAKLKKYGYLGIFIISIIGNIAVFSPAAPFAAALGGHLFNPWIASLITTIGAVIGELASYFIGSASELFIPDSMWINQLHYYMEINGALTVFIISLIPNPFFDVIGIAAGASGFPLWKFIIFSFLGKWIKFTLFSLAGHGFKHAFIK